MGRDSNGNYSSPSGAFVSGTIIDSAVMNGKLNDIGSEITNSLDRNGQGGMLTYLRGVDGTVNLPAYSFTSEITLGIMRFGSGDLRAVKDGTSLMKWSTSEVRVYSAGVFEKGLTVTNSTSNGAGTTSTGNGTGDGVVGTGGATGDGGTFTGGATSGTGVVATGTGGGNGITATGQGTGYGIVATGGAAGGGGIFAGGATGGTAVTATGTGGGSGVTASGQGAGHGISATGGATGKGGVFAAGTASTGADPTVAVELTNGHLKLSGTAPNKDEALSNTLAPTNIPKAIAKLTTAGGGSTAVTVADNGFNVSSATASATTITVTLGTAVAATGVAIVTPGANSGAQMYFVPRATVVGSTVTINAVELEHADSSGPVLNVSDFDFQNEAQTVTLNLVVFGAQ